VERHWRFLARKLQSEHAAETPSAQEGPKETASGPRTVRSYRTKKKVLWAGVIPFSWCGVTEQTSAAIDLQAMIAALLY
jgi:hypothetical protein